MTGSLDMQNNRIQHAPLQPVDTSSTCSAAFIIQEDQKLRNGTQVMIGHLNMCTHGTKNVVDPVDPQDAATKDYVEDDWHAQDQHRA